MLKSHNFQRIFYVIAHESQEKLCQNCEILSTVRMTSSIKREVSFIKPTYRCLKMKSCFKGIKHYYTLNFQFVIPLCQNDIIFKFFSYITVTEMESKCCQKFKIPSAVKSE